MTARAARSAALALAFAVGGCASLLGTQDFEDTPASLAYADLADSGFTGDLAVSLPGEPFTIYYGGPEPEAAGERAIEGWPWASVTKQVVAVLVMREVEDGTLALDSDVGAILPRLRGRGLTVEDLLRHRSDLPNPDETLPDDQGISAFYTDRGDALRYCTGQGAARAEGTWSYNNCDYIVLGEVLEQVTGTSLDLLLAQGVGLSADWINTDFIEAGSDRAFAKARPGDARILAGYGASGALVGPLDDMLLFDRALMEGDLLGEEALATLWDADPGAGYMALGQWVFEAPLEGCAGPQRIVERNGAIGRYRVRNIILPDLGIAVALATDQAEFDFGEIWSGSGIMHHLLSTVACG